LHLAWYEFVEFTKMKVLSAFLLFSSACLAQTAGLGSGCPSGVLSSLGCSTTLPSGLTIGPVASPFQVANANGYSGLIAEVGNTTVPPLNCTPTPCISLPVNSIGELGPNAASLTSWFKQWPQYAPTTASLVLAGPVTITVIFTNSSAVITGANSFPIGAALSFINSGGGYPTSFSPCASPQVCYVIATGLSSTQFEVSATYGGSAIVANSAGTGTTTVTGDITPMSFASVIPFATGVNLTSLGATPTAGFSLLNPTASISGATAQYAPAENICGTAYNSSSTLSETDCFQFLNEPATNAGATTSSLFFRASINGGAYSTVGSVNNAGTWVLPALTVSGSGTLFQGISNSTGTYYACLGPAGTGTLTYDTATCGSSLLALKENIEDLDEASAVAEIMRMRPVTFDWKRGTRSIDAVSGMHDVGMIADWTAAIDPLLGSYDKDGQLENWKDREVLTLAIKTIQEQQKKLEALEARIAALETRQ